MRGFLLRGKIKSSVLERIYPVTLIFSTFASDMPYNVTTMNMQLLQSLEDADLDLEELSACCHHNPRHSMNCRAL